MGSDYEAQFAAAVSQFEAQADGSEQQAKIAMIEAIEGALDGWRVCENPAWITVTVLFRVGATI